ncbi:hypothetical protein N2152v2_000082 [Parachlorella kessleri]
MIGSSNIHSAKARCSGSGKRCVRFLTGALQSVELEGEEPASWFWCCCGPRLTVAKTPTAVGLPAAAAAAPANVVAYASAGRAFEGVSSFLVSANQCLVSWNIKIAERSGGKYTPEGLKEFFSEQERLLGENVNRDSEAGSAFKRVHDAKELEAGLKRSSVLPCAVAQYFPQGSNSGVLTRAGEAASAAASSVAGVLKDAADELMPTGGSEPAGERQHHHEMKQEQRQAHEDYFHQQQQHGKPSDSVAGDAIRPPGR